MKSAFFPIKRIVITTLCTLPLIANAAPEEQSVDSILTEYVLLLNQSPIRETLITEKSVAEELNLWTKMRRQFKMTEVSSDIVQKFEEYYANHPEYFGRIAMRSSPYIYHILNEVEKRRMPGEIALLPFIESAFVIKAKSHAGAMGLWQFMPKTGKQYGLTQNNWYDGRNDVYASTDAALEYLEYLHGLFGDWALALAAYNCGENCVERAQNKAQSKGLPTSFEYLELPRETREYVPKLLAVRNLVNNPTAFDVELGDIDNRPYFESVKLDQPIDLKAIARLAEISEEEVLQLNPGYRVPVWVPQSGRKLLLPKTSVETFYENLKQADSRELLSWKPFVVSGEQNVADIAAQHDMNVEELKKVNNLRSSRIPSGSVLLVQFDPMLSSIQENEEWEEPDFIAGITDNYTQNKKTRTTTSTIKVGKGMTLNAIAKKYGMTVAELKKANGLRSNTVKAGQTLKVKTTVKATAGNATKKSKTQNGKTIIAKTNKKTTQKQKSAGKTKTTAKPTNKQKSAGKTKTATKPANKQKSAGKKR